MAAGDYLNQYIEGWTKGDAQILTSSLADSYYLMTQTPGKSPKRLWLIIWAVCGK